MSSEYRTCEVCEEEIQGRSDKEYCSRKCNNKVNNERRREEELLLKPFLKQYRDTYRSLKKIFPESNGEKYIPLTNAIQQGFNFKSPCTKFKVDELPYELTRIANYAYRIDPTNHTIIVFKLN